MTTNRNGQKKLATLAGIVISIALGGTAHWRSSDRFTGAEALKLEGRISTVEVRAARNEIEISQRPPQFLLDRISALQKELKELREMVYELSWKINGRQNRFPREGE